MLLGEHEHTIDEKNRLTLPARFREELGAGVVVTRGLDECLNVFAREEWERVVGRQLDALDPFSREAREMERYYYSGAVEVEIDRQGRVMIPAPLSTYAKLGREVVVAGVRNRLEVWDREAWRKQRDEFEGSAEHVAERLARQRS
ncbi:MAG TPA: division/cell wall cluster transcriptional repressor MraZ [Gaiellaceae bacterium]|nr:division/cell wall cluster transcriptional repressor MraZ [Gaiellaceae bacterium]